VYDTVGVLPLAGKPMRQALLHHNARADAEATRRELAAMLRR